MQRALLFEFFDAFYDFDDCVLVIVFTCQVNDLRP